MRVGNTGALDQVVAHGCEVLLKAVADLRGVIRVVQLGNPVDGYALDPCAQGSEVPTGVPCWAQDDVGVLCQVLLLFGLFQLRKYKTDCFTD